MPPRRTGPQVCRATITIHDLALRTVIGINRWERTKPQDVILNITIDFDPSRAIVSDKVADTLDYKRIKRTVIDLVEKSRFGLVEKLAHTVLAAVMKDRRVLGASVRVEKPHALRFARSVSVYMSAEKT